MIADATQYQKAQEEIRSLEERLQKLQQDHAIGSKGFTKAGIRKMIARLHEELAEFEGSEEARQSDPSLHIAFGDSSPGPGPPEAAENRRGLARPWKRSGHGQRCCALALGAKCACPPLPGRFSDRLVVNSDEIERGGARMHFSTPDAWSWVVATPLQ